MKETKGFNPNRRIEEGDRVVLSPYGIAHLFGGGRKSRYYKRRASGGEVVRRGWRGLNMTVKWDELKMPERLFSGLLRKVKGGRYG